MTRWASIILTFHIVSLLRGSLTSLLWNIRNFFSIRMVFVHDKVRFARRTVRITVFTRW